MLLRQTIKRQQQHTVIAGGNEAAEAVDHAMQSTTPELKWNYPSNRSTDRLLPIDGETDGLLSQLLPNRDCTSPRVETLHQYQAGSSGAADAHESTNAAQRNDVTQHRRGHSSSLTSSAV